MSAIAAERIRSRVASALAILTTDVVERRGLAEHRGRLVAGLSGRVIEVGAGNGPNFPHYPDSVEQVLAVEPEDYLRERAHNAALEAPVPIEVRAGLAERLPADDESFDVGIASLVLCSVHDPRLAELFRVIREGGELRSTSMSARDSRPWRGSRRSLTRWFGLGSRAAAISTATRRA
jgi:ubiquinone/menaquinone biosynthesis C-methylase UbiE